MEEKAYLVLENGQIFAGKAFGARKRVVGETVFTTAMTGYLETLTDPSYFGQMVVQTFPLIGNYGVIPSDFESKKPACTAYIVRDWCQVPSNFRSEGQLDAFLKACGVPGIYGVDTRELTKVIREYGVMNGEIVYDPAERNPDAVKNYRIGDAVASVSVRKAETIAAENPSYRVALWDFGAKENICRELAKRGCEVIRMPHSATAEELLAVKPDGLMLSNGPGDPAENTGIIRELRKICGVKLPVFGICLGHQLLALAQGAKTHKLPYGHRGANQPAKRLDTGRVFITSQNHGYAVENDSLPENAVLSYVNANDGTCEGVCYTDIPAFSVQFHPEAAAGPMDTGFLFDEFISLMEGGRSYAAEKRH